MSTDTASRTRGPSRLYAVEDALARVEKVIVVLAMAVMFVAGVAQVAVRLGGARSLGTDEVVTLSMAVLVFVGAGLIVRTADHIAIEVLQYLPDLRMRRVLRGIGLIALVVFGFVFGYYAWDFTSTVTGERTLQLGIPVVVSAGAMVIGSVLIVVHAAGALVRLVMGEDQDHGDGMNVPRSEGEVSGR